MEQGHSQRERSQGDFKCYTVFQQPNTSNPAVIQATVSMQARPPRQEVNRKVLFVSQGATWELAQRVVDMSLTVLGFLCTKTINKWAHAIHQE